MISLLEARRRAVPVAPTAVERMKPGLERSIMYQRTGFTRARVREAWRVEVQGSFLCFGDRGISMYGWILDMDMG
jgi:hypothetical protein